MEDCEFDNPASKTGIGDFFVSVTRSRHIQETDYSTLYFKLFYSNIYENLLPQILCSLC